MLGSTIAAAQAGAAQTMAALPRLVRVRERLPASWSRSACASRS